MKRINLSRAWLGVLAGFVALAAMVAVAKDGRDFAGFYAVSNVTNLGEEVRVTLTVRVSDQAPSPLDDAGNANPDFNFRYDASLDGYIFNLSTRGFATGTYLLFFTVAGDPVEHSLEFQVK